MPKKNFKKIIIGFVLIIFGVALAAVAFYYLEVKPELAKRNAVASSESVASAKKDASGLVSGKNKVLSEKILRDSRENSLRYPKKRPDQEDYSAENKRAQGILWIDHQASRYIVTLGTIHGISQGQKLTVYDERKQIGQVKVIMASDVISYVRPMGDVMQYFKNNNYYRVDKQ